MQPCGLCENRAVVEWFWFKKVDRISAAFLEFVDFCSYLKQRFFADHCIRSAASLAYTSLLALVPLFTIVFVALAAFPPFQELREDFEDFIFRNFVPALGDQVRGYLLEFSDKAKGLQAAGTLVLLITVLALMSTIESTFNVIWRIQRRRPFVVRFLVYWAVLTLGPLLIGASIFVTSYLVSLPLLPSSMETLGLKIRMLGAVPILSTTLAFVMFFKLIPYRPVPFRHAMVGGLVAGILFEAAKRGFAIYVTSFPMQQAVYGAFATLPIFLLWIFLSWVIVLLGAEITQCLTTYKAVSSRKRSSLYANPVYAAFRVLLRLFQAQEAGEPLADKKLFVVEPDLGFEAINQALERLDRANWISRNDAFQWVLIRDLHRETVVDLMQIAPTFPHSDDAPAAEFDGADERFLSALRTHAEWLDQHMATPIADLILNEDTPVAGELPVRPLPP